MIQYQIVIKNYINHSMAKINTQMMKYGETQKSKIKEMYCTKFSKCTNKKEMKGVAKHIYTT